MTKTLLLSYFISFVTVVAAQSTELAPVKVIVTNFSDVRQSGESIEFVSVKNKKKYKGVSGADGTFSVELPGDDTYSINIVSVGDDQKYSEVTMPKLGPKQQYGEVTLTVKFEMPKEFTLDNVYFETGSARLNKNSFAELNELQEYMSLKKDLRIEIGGHTDSVGTAANNMKLSQKRANAVKSYLVTKGINTKRIIAVGYGETMPASRDNSKNRRTQVRIL